MRGDKAKHCPFHSRGGHTLEECKAFCAKTLDERTRWILQAGLSYRCLVEGYRAKDCRKNINDNRHTALLHKERKQRPVSGESVEMKCTYCVRPRSAGSLAAQ